MKNAILCAAMFVAFVLASSESAEAGRRVRFRNIRQNSFMQRSNGPGFFQRVMDLERRKNAWIRATFF